VGGLLPQLLPGGHGPRLVAEANPASRCADIQAALRRRAPGLAGRLVVRPPRALAVLGSDAEPYALPPAVAEAQLLPQHRRSLVAGLAARPARLWGLYRVCASALGAVLSADTIKSMDATFDTTIEGRLRKWKFRPYLAEGHPVSFCSVLRLDLHHAR
jgi:hypothetical protein